MPTTLYIIGNSSLFYDWNEIRGIRPSIKLVTKERKQTFRFPSCKVHTDFSSRPLISSPNSKGKLLAGSREKKDHILSCYSLLMSNTTATQSYYSFRQFVSLSVTFDLQPAGLRSASQDDVTVYQLFSVCIHTSNEEAEQSGWGGGWVLCLKQLPMHAWPEDLFLRYLPATTFGNSTATLFVLMPNTNKCSLHSFSTNFFLVKIWLRECVSHIPSHMHHWWLTDFEVRKGDDGAYGQLFHANWQTK